MKEERPAVSVIIPVYGAEAYLDQCITSVLSQSLRDLEIILVDDGSKDRSGDICDAYEKKDDRIRVHHQENEGLMRAWQKGVLLSRGAYLYFLDADDWLEEGALGALYRALSFSGKKEIICSNGLIDPGDGRGKERLKKQTHALPPGVYEKEALQTRVKEKILGNERRTVDVSRCMKLFTRQLITENVKYCEDRIRFGEDLNITLPAILSCERLVVLSGHHDYHYRFRRESMVHGYDRGLYENVKLLDAVIRSILQEKFREEGIAEVDPSQMADQEKVWLMTYVLKNEIRSTEAGTLTRAVRICQKEQLKEMLEKYRLQAKAPVNRMLLFFMRHPGKMLAWLDRKVFEFYDQRQNA